LVCIGACSHQLCCCCCCCCPQQVRGATNYDGPCQPNVNRRVQVCKALGACTGSVLLLMPLITSRVKDHTQHGCAALTVCRRQPLPQRVPA
jgi:hypothetical protein